MRIWESSWACNTVSSNYRHSKKTSARWATRNPYITSPLSLKKSMLWHWDTVATMAGNWPTWLLHLHQTATSQTKAQTWSLTITQSLSRWLMCPKLLVPRRLSRTRSSSYRHIWCLWTISNLTICLRPNRLLVRISARALFQVPRRRMVNTRPWNTVMYPMPPQCSLQTSHLLFSSNSRTSSRCRWLQEAPTHLVRSSCHKASFLIKLLTRELASPRIAILWNNIRPSTPASVRA